MEGSESSALENNPLGIYSNTKNNNIEAPICRVCLAKSKVMIDIFKVTPGTTISIAEMISQCTGIYISQGQSFPKTICRSCVRDAQNSFEFKQKFERSHQYFSQFKQELLEGDVCKIPDGASERLNSEMGTDLVKKGVFEVYFLEDKEPKPEDQLPYQVKNEPIEEDLFVGEEFHITDISNINHSESQQTEGDRNDTISQAVERPFKCSQCQKTFIRERQLTTHLRVHTGERPFQCELCPKAFTQKHILKLHIHTHTGERPFKCSHCPKSFSQKSTQQAHIRIHTGERPYQCVHCPRTFCQQAHLQKHQRKHTDERPYRCPNCPQAFADNSNLKRHCTVHHKELKKS